MRYLVLATDYDETLADEGQVSPDTISALERLRMSGRRLLLVSGRELDDLKQVFGRLDLFAYIVAENGGVLFDPGSGEVEKLAQGPDPEFVRRLQASGVAPLHVGRTIVATREPHETVALEAVRDLGLELQLTFNKGAVMILPSGVNKATGLHAALDRLGLSAHNVVAIGDAENDHAFLAACEASAAVVNGIASLREEADFVTRYAAGAGVAELIDGLLADDLKFLEPRLPRHDVPLGDGLDRSQVGIPPYGSFLMVTGTSGGGKSRLTLGLLERLAERDYQFCLVDPEGDYPEIGDAIVLGSQDLPPSIEELEQALRAPRPSVIVNLLGVALLDRPAMFEQIALKVREMQGQYGRPHWIVVDEAHHTLPAEHENAALLRDLLGSVVLVTPHPELLPRDVADLVNSVIAVGPNQRELFQTFLTRRHIEAEPPQGELDEEEMASFWLSGHPAQLIHPYRARTERVRHQRKYAEGELGEERSFYFTGPERRLNLRAQNLMIFPQLADGLDDETFDFHLRRGDYTRWFRDVIKDTDMADAAVEVEQAPVEQARPRLRAIVEERYTLPGTAPTGSSEVGPDQPKQ